jgi:flagellar hook protein FlgE
LATTTFTKTGTGNAATGAAGAATGGNTWAYTIEIDGYDPAIVTGKLEFDQAGHLAEIDDVAVTTNASGAVTLARTAARTFTPTPTGLPGGNGAEPLQFSIDLTKLTQHGTQSTADAQSTDGYPSGMLDKTSVTIDGNGVMVGSFSNGRLKVLGQVGLSKFTNPAGLNKIGTSLYMQSNNSGAPQVNVAGMDGLGEISSSALEMSNVDLSEEFTTMITTQRGFQANSRIITTSDSMLEELVNLKR